MKRALYRISSLVAVICLCLGMFAAGYFTAYKHGAADGYDNGYTAGRSGADYGAAIR